MWVDNENMTILGVWLRLIGVKCRGIFRALSHIYDEAFLKSPSLMFNKVLNRPLKIHLYLTH